MEIAERRWVVEWRVSVRSRLEGVRTVVLVRFARSADGACSVVRKVIADAIDGEVRIGIYSSDRTFLRPAIVANEASIAAWNPVQEVLPARYWRSRWVESDRAANVRCLVGMDFEEAILRCVHARLLDDKSAAALLNAIDAALDAHSAAT